MSTQQANGLSGKVMMAALAGLVVSAGIALYNLMTQGHASFNTGSAGVTWGLPVVAYVYFVLTSTGLTFVASLAMVFGFKDFYPIATRCIWLAVATLLAGFAALALELGHPFRMLWAIPLSFQYMSPLNWMGTFYLLYLVLLLLKFQKINAGDWNSGASRNLGIASFIAVVLAHGTLGGVFGAMAMRPMWYGPMIPLYFLLTAALCGAAFAVLITYLAYGSQQGMPDKVRALMTGPMPKVFAAVLVITLIASVSRTAIGLWSNADGLQVWDAIIASPWYWAEMIGMIIPLFILLSPEQRSQGTMQMAAALLVIVALFIGRYEFVIGGQLLPMFKGSWVPGLIDYVPSLTEWMLALLALSATFVIYGIGEKMFNLSAAPSE